MKNFAVFLSLVSLLFVFQHSNAQTDSKKITIYSDDFVGNKYELGVGRYDNMHLVRGGILTVKSVKVPRGMKVTLYERDQFDGPSLELTDDANMRYLEGKGFAKTIQNVSLVVEVLPADSHELTGPFVTIYKDDFAGASKRLLPGQYEFNELGNVDNDNLSSIKIPTNVKVTLYEHGGFTGRTLVLTKDTRAAFLVSNKFNDVTSSILIEKIEPAPAVAKVVTEVAAPVVQQAEPVADVIVEAPSQPLIYQGDFSGTSKSIAPGRYGSDQLGIGNDQLSSIKVPRGFRVTLYEGDAFEGRTLTLTTDARAAFLVDNKFNNITSSILVEALPMATLYADDYAGDAGRLEPGRYYSYHLGIGNDRLSSVRVPRGLRVTLFEEEDFMGRSLVLTQDAGLDVITESGFNDITSSVIVEIIVEKVIVQEKPAAAPVVQKEDVVVVKEAVAVPPAQPATPPCEMNSAEFQNASTAIQSKSWDVDKMNVAKVSTREKCLSLLQIRSIGGFFMSDDVKLEFVTYAYERSNEKTQYYLLQDMFSYPSNQEKFTKFITKK